MESHVLYAVTQWWVADLANQIYLAVHALKDTIYQEQLASLAV